MKFKTLLLEDIESSKKAYPDISDDTLEELMRIDPTFNPNENRVGNYWRWIVAQYKKGNIDLASTQDIKDNLNIFELNKKAFQNKDIFQFKTPEDLENALLDIPEIELTSRQELRKVQKLVSKSDISKEAELIWSQGDWKVYQPKTYEASCKLGRGSKWCTATTANRSYYDSYIERGPLYIFQKEGKPFYQLHIDEEEKENFDEPHKIVTLTDENDDLYVNPEKYPQIVQDFLKEKEEFVYKLLYYDQITSLTLSEEEVSVKERYKNLKEVHLKDTVKNIKENAFVWNKKLEYVTFPKTPISIEEGAFANTAVKEINIPNLHYLGVSAFRGCKNLESFIVKGGDLDVIDTNIFRGCENLREIAFLKTGKAVARGAFSDLEYTYIIIKEVEKIGAYSFFNLQNSEVWLSKSLKEIGRDAFSFAKNVTINFDGTLEEFNSIKPLEGSWGEEDWPFLNKESNLIINGEIVPKLQIGFCKHFKDFL